MMGFSGRRWLSDRLRTTSPGHETIQHVHWRESMGSLPYLDIAIGLSFAYLLLALACTSLNETIASILRTRGAFLDKGISRWVHDPKLKRELYVHRLCNSKAEKADRIGPSYIGLRKFAVALLVFVRVKEEEGKNIPATDEQLLMKKVEEHPNP